MRKSNAITKPKHNWRSLSCLHNGLRLARSTLHNAGRGVFAQRVFYPGDAICEYSGTILTARRAKNMRYAVALSSKYILDGFQFPCKHRMNVGSMINDAKDPQRTNCAILIVSDAKRFRYKTGNENRGAKKISARAFIVCVYQPIQNGQELFLSYGKRYWKHHGA